MTITQQQTRPTGIAARIGASSLEQPKLPFSEDALEPVISAKTIGFHYGKHHKGYFNKLEKLVEGTAMRDRTLEEIIIATAGSTASRNVFNNAAQCWNHNFYWNSLSPREQTPSGPLAEAIQRDFGSLDACREALAECATGHFGSGWAWLVVDGGKLKVLSTADADVPFTRDQFPLLTVDVWEHAYYLDYQNRRPDHVKAIVNGHLNWAFAEENFKRA